MKKVYKQLTLGQRYQLEVLLQTDMKVSKIAEQLDVHRSTIYREKNRNAPKRGRGAKVYVAERAHQKTVKRHKEKPKKKRFTPKLKREMLDWMTTKKYSPELVSAQWKINGTDGVSHETLYSFIWNCKHTNKRENLPYKKTHQLLKHGKRRRKRGNYKDSRGTIPNRVSIDQRPKIVEKRKRTGDIETDLIMGKNNKSALVVSTDRASIKTTIDKVKGKTASVIRDKIIKRLSQMGEIKTITFDNDQAFALHQEIAKALKAKTYFTRPYTSQDKGTVENRNGVIRLFFPKKTDFNQVSHWQVKRVERMINQRPVRKFDYKTPNEMFKRLSSS